MSKYTLIIEGNHCTAKTVKVGCKFFEVREDGFDIYKKTRKGKLLLSQATTWLEVYEHADNSK